MQHRIPRGLNARDYMGTKKFNKRAFKKWLDALAALVAKTKAGWKCQVGLSPECQRVLTPLSENAQVMHCDASRRSNVTRWQLENLLAGCANCHGYAHSNEGEFHVWFGGAFPDRARTIRMLKALPAFTWKPDDFLAEEEILLDAALECNVDYLNMCERYRKRLKRRLEERSFEKV